MHVMVVSFQVSTGQGRSPTDTLEPDPRLPLLEPKLRPEICGGWTASHDAHCVM